MSVISDGTGDSYAAQVTSAHKLATLSVSENIAAHHTFSGDSYNINTGTVTLSSGSKSALLYLKNNEDEPLVVQTIIYLIGTNTGGSGDALIQVERNPTGGTIVSGASTQAPVNRNFGSAKTLLADSYKGAEGNTLTGGTVVVESIFPSVGRQVIADTGIILEKGNSIGVTVTPPTSTSDQDYQIALSVYRATETTI